MGTLMPLEPMLSAHLDSNDVATSQSNFPCADLANAWRRFPLSRNQGGSRIRSSLGGRISVCLLDCVGWQGPLRSVKYFRKLVPRRRESLWHLRCTRTESRARFLQASAIARNQPWAWLFDWPQYR